MKFPLILIEGNDVNFFGTKDSLQNYVESSDIDRYQAFDSDGLRLRLTSVNSTQKRVKFVEVLPVSNVIVEQEIPYDYAVEELSDALKRFILQVKGIHASGSLQNLTKISGNILGY